MRAIAILSVVLIHTTPSGIAQAYIRPFINMGVAVFIFLSGYLTSFDRINTSMQKRRIARVLIPYIIWITIYTLVHQLVTIHDINISQLLKNLITSKAGPQFYFVLVYMEFVTLLPFIKRLALSRYRVWGWLIAPIATVLFKYIPLFAGIELPRYVSLLWDDCFLGWFTFYYLGLLLRNNLLHIQCQQGKLWLFYIVSLFVQMGEGLIWYHFGEANCGTQLKLSSYLTSSIFCLLTYYYIQAPEANQQNVVVKIAKTLGDCSFGIYLCHILLMQTIAHLFIIYRQLPFIANTTIIVIASTLFVLAGQKICNKKLAVCLGLY